MASVSPPPPTVPCFVLNKIFINACSIWVSSFATIHYPFSFGFCTITAHSSLRGPSHGCSDPKSNSKNSEAKLLDYLAKSSVMPNVN
ncbi:hypothetical protein A4A49_14648 [Nicotiana attenuata]|uniref:Uncharacterized protein n=1 Tax=Nicotiana attenuata TaxID=49451 RepID=A0A314L223_NICAT|nr:hypothetical protein A4A49_14648 [Nicotiana attenuata]